MVGADVQSEAGSKKTGDGTENAGKSKTRFPDTTSNTVAYWLLGSAASVFGIVVFGGLTRLTESGYVFSVSAETTPVSIGENER